MRITWVHPSWRDLVIEHLSAEGGARDRFLRSASIHGALLALSSAGGSAGRRRTPLLKVDADWDALTDRLYALAPELEEAELIGLLDTLLETLAGPHPAQDAAEATALSRALLGRVAALWDAKRAPISLPALEAWLTLAAQLDPRPKAPPELGMTWAELLPARDADFGDRASLERLADWLALAELLRAYDPPLVNALGFGEVARQRCERFLVTMRGPRAPVDEAQARRALRSISLLLPDLAPRAEILRYGLAFDLAPPAPRTPTPPPPPTAGQLDVLRILLDL